MRRLLNNLTFRVLAAITLGIIVGLCWPQVGKELKPLGETFISAVKMVMYPIIFLTVVLGIARVADLKKVGRIGGKALIYFEVVTTMALIIGFAVVRIVKPGVGLDIAGLQGGNIAGYQSAAAGGIHWSESLTHIVSPNIVESFAKGDILQILFFAILFGFGLAALREEGRPVIDLFDKILTICFNIISYIMVFAPIGAFGAMAFTIGNYGVATLLPLMKLLMCVYITMFLFVFVVLNMICHLYKFSLWQYLKYIKDEILIVLGTASSESVLPRLMVKMEKYGCPKTIVGLVIPTGYSFNLDGTSIYLAAAVVFLAQVFKVDLTIVQELTIIGVLIVTSKGAAAVTGGGFIVLASTLTAISVIPVEGLALLLGIDRFMSEARAVVNLIGNGIATIVISKSEKAFEEQDLPVFCAAVSEP